MNKRVPRADFKWAKFPKMKKIKKNPEKVKPTPEIIIQSITDRELREYNIPFLRLPDNMFKAVILNPNLSGKLKGWILHELAGWADNIAFLPLNDRFCLCCMIENKSATGKLSKKQREKSKEMPYNIVRNKDQAREIIQEFLAFTINLKKKLEGLNES